MKRTSKLALALAATTFAVAGVILAQGRHDGVADDASWSTDTLGDAYQSACNEQPSLCLDPADCQSDCSGRAPGELDNCNRVCPGTGDSSLGLAASYVPSPGASRTQTVSYSASPAPISFFYDESLGHFEERPGGACSVGGDNPTYFRIQLVGGTVTACRYRASWDTAYYTCTAGLVQALNGGASVVINTDRYLVDPATCAARDPLVLHVGVNQLAWLDVELTDAAGTALRRVAFVKSPVAGPHDPPHPQTP